MNETRENKLFCEDQCSWLFAFGQVTFSLLLSLVVAIISAFGGQTLHKNEINYLAGKQIVETIPFNDLQTSTCSDRTVIKVTPSAEYPKDKMVEYKSVVFPVENHDGKSVVVATYVLRNSK